MTQVRLYDDGVLMRVLNCRTTEEAEKAAQEWHADHIAHHARIGELE